MSNTISFKYSIGDKVFAAGSKYSDASIECPSCFGKKVVTVTFGDGSSEVIPCPTCKLGYGGPYGRIYYKKYIPTVECLTIGSFRHDGEENTYMCEETGVGGGRVYREGALFDNYDSALIAAHDADVKQQAYILEQNYKKRERFAQDVESILGYSRREALLAKKRLNDFLALINKHEGKS